MSLMSIPLNPRVSGAKAAAAEAPPSVAPAPPVPADDVTEQQLIDLFGLEGAPSVERSTNTLIHARLQAIADTSKSSATAVSSLVTATDRQSSALTDALHTTKLDLVPLAAGLGGIEQRIGTSSAPVLDLQPLTAAILGISLKIEDQKTAIVQTIEKSIGGLGGSAETSAVPLDEPRRDCLRAINRVEQLLLDREPENNTAEKARKNNVDFEKLRKSGLAKAAEAGFASLRQLEAWHALSADFDHPENAEGERSLRLVSAHQLRRIVLFNSRA